ncbi:MAG: hypothetical protein WA130_05340 [Candidatus Methanoperedens sp.]
MIKDDLTEKVPFDTAIINNHTYFSALNPWTLDDQIEDLANHIKVSFEKCQDSNSLWTYFGLSSSAQPIKEEDSDAKINFLIKQVEALREKMNPSRNLDRLRFRSMRSEIERTLSPVTVLKIEDNYPQLRFTLSGELDTNKKDSLLGMIISLGYEGFSYVIDTKGT